MRPMTVGVSPENTMRALSVSQGARIGSQDTGGAAPAELQTYLTIDARETAIVDEAARQEFSAARYLAGQQLNVESFRDDRGQPFTVGASVIAKQTIAYQANDGSGIKHMASGTRGEIVTFGGTREHPTAAVQFDGRLALHLFNARELRAMIRVIL